VSAYGENIGFSRFYFIGFSRWDIFQENIPTLTGTNTRKKLFNSITRTD